MEGDYQPMEVQPLPTAPRLPDNFFDGQASMSGADIEALIQSITPQQLSQPQNAYAIESSSGAGPVNYQPQPQSEGGRQTDGSSPLSEMSEIQATKSYGERLTSDVQGVRGLGEWETDASVMRIPGLRGMILVIR